MHMKNISFVRSEEIFGLCTFIPFNFWFSQKLKIEVRSEQKSVIDFDIKDTMCKTTILLCINVVESVITHTKTISNVLNRNKEKKISLNSYSLLQQYI